ncbi:adenylate/guanylate cyclase domain-containing protein [Ramlibacter humi]|nr:adenylate/guanylate cyclase domain-containing protein [Ramlibacter humi]
MEDAAFVQWLTHRSWTVTVRYSKVVAVVLPLASLATNLQLLHDPAAPSLGWLIAWQVATEAVFLSMLLADRWQASASELLLNAFCAAFIGLCTWSGMVDISMHRDLSVYAAGMTFGAAVAAMRRRIRQPLYALSVIGLGCAFWQREGGDLERTLTGLLNPFCVVVLCLWLDRFTFARDLALYTETQRAETERKRADEVLHNALPRAVAEEIKRDGRARARKFDNLGVLFADIVGFTRFSSGLPPEQLVLVLDDIFSGFDRLADWHGVEKIKTIGDAYMAVSHVRVDALCRLALDMRLVLARYNRENGTELAMRIGVHAGPAVGGVLGVRRFLYDVWGDTVNVASRLESSGREGGIQVSEAVVRQAGAAFDFSARGLVDLRGRGPLLAYWLLRERVAPVARAELQAA